MNRKQKQDVAAFIIGAVGDRLEFLEEFCTSGHGDPALLDIDRDEMLAYIGQTLSKLPGDYWHSSLPNA